MIYVKTQSITKLVRAQSREFFEKAPSHLFSQIFSFFFFALTITLFVCTVNKVKRYARYDLETFCSI